MDPPTQALLGAAVGQVGFSHRLGRRAIVWGALLGALPDLDVVAVATHGPWGEFLYHRGSTHALWFGPVVGPLLGWLLWRFYGRNEPAGPAMELRRPWMLLAALALLSHPLLDLFTTYGTQLLAPFDRTRFALNAVPIIDPLYSLPLVVALAVGLRRASPTSWRRGAAAVALVASTGYLLYGYQLNRAAEDEARSQLRAQAVDWSDVRSYPTLFQVYLRRIVVDTPGAVRVGFVSLWRPEPIVWTEAPRQDHPAIERLRAHPRGALFEWFAMGEIAARAIAGPEGTVVELEDLRYGFPGPADRGLWGVRAHYDPGGELRGEVERFDREPPAPIPELLRTLWSSAFP